MPKGFTQCVKRGGRVRTIKPKAGKYMPICYSGGKSYAGEVKTAKSPARKRTRKRVRARGKKR